MARDLSHLGHGLISPMRREGRDFLHAGGATLIRSRVERVLGTMAARRDGRGGEMPWRLAFGSRLYLLRHRKLSAGTSELARFYAEEALRRWEPAVIVDRVTVTADIARGRLRVLVSYRLIKSDVPGNRVVLGGQEAEVVV